MLKEEALWKIKNLKKSNSNQIGYPRNPLIANGFYLAGLIENNLHKGLASTLIWWFACLFCLFHLSSVICLSVRLSSIIHLPNFRAPACAVRQHLSAVPTAQVDVDRSALPRQSAFRTNLASLVCKKGE